MTIMKAVKRKKKSIFLRIALIAFSIYIAAVVIYLQMEINALEKNNSDLDSTTARQTIVNEDLQKQNDNPNQYLEKNAREQGYAKPGEIVYIEVPEN